MASNIFAGDIEFDNKKHMLKNNNRDIFGDIQFESSDGQEWGSTSKTNEFNKIKTGINRFLGLEHDKDYLKLVAIQEGKSFDDILKEFNLAQMNDFQATVGEFFHQATLGLLNNPAEFESTGNTLQDIGFATSQTISGGLGMLAGFGVLDKGLEVFGKTMKYVSAASKLDKVLSNVKLVRKFAQIDTKANMFYRMAKTGATFGMYNAIDSFMQNNERYNDYYTALDKAAPDALQGFFFGLGIPLLGSAKYKAFSKFVQKSKLGKAIVAMGLKDTENVTKPFGAIALQGITSQVFQGTNSLTQIYDGLKDKSPMRVIGSIMNVMFSAAIGLGAYDYSKFAEVRPEDLRLIEKATAEAKKTIPMLSNKFEINFIRNSVEELSNLVEMYNNKVDVRFFETLGKEIDAMADEYHNGPEDVKLIKEAIADAQKRTVNISVINDDNVIVTTKANDKTYQEELKKPEISELILSQAGNDVSNANALNDGKLPTGNDITFTPPNKLKIGEYVKFIPNKEEEEYGVKPVEGVVDSVSGSVVFINDIHNTHKLVKTKDVWGKYVRFQDILNQKDRNVIHNNNKLTEEEFKNKYKDLGKSIANNLNRLGLPFEKIKILGSFANKHKSNDIDVFIKVQPSDIKELGKGYDRQYENALANIRYKGLPIDVFEVGWDDKDNEKAFGRRIDIYDKNIKDTLSQPDISNVIDAIKQDLNNYKGMKRVPTASGDTAVEPVAGDKPSFIRDKRSNPNGLLKKDVLSLIKKFEKGELTDDEQRQFNKILRKYSENEATNFSDVVNNYIKQFSKLLEEPEDKDKIDDMWFLGGANIKYAWNKTLEDIRNKTVPFEKPKTNILKRLMYWAINPYAMQYLKDPVLKELGTELNKAEHRVELKTMKFREPVYNVADEFAGLYKVAKDKLKKDYKGFESAVNKAIVEGNRQGEDPNKIFIKNGKYVQYADLAKNIFSKHRKFYYESRKRLNKFMEETLDHLKDVLGKDVIEKLKKYTYAEIEERPYFMPQQRDVGNVHIVVRDLDGKVIERYHEFDPVALLLGRSYKAKKIIEQMKKKYGADNIIYEVKEPEPLDITKIDALNLLDIINNVVDNTDITKEQRQKIIDNIIKEVKSKGFMAHTIHRSKREIGGYIEDPLRAMQLYLSQATAFVSKQSMKWELNEIEQNLSYKWNSDVRKMFKWHKEQLLGNKTTLDKTVNYVRSFLFLRYLGLNFKNAFVNVVFQQPITAMHLIAELGGKNLFDPLKASGILTKAGKDILTGNLTDREKAVIDTLDKLGITKDQKNQFMLGRSALLTKTWNNIMETAGLFMKHTEILNRKTAALAYLRVHPELMGDEAIAKARDFVYTTNGKYGDSELAVMFQGKGALKSLGKVGQTFQTYNHQILLGFLKLHNEKQYGAILFGVGALMFMGGLRLMPFYDSIKSEYTKLTGRDLEVDLHKKLDNGEINFLLNGGLMGNLPLGLATDISSSAGFQMPTDELSYSGKGIGDVLMSQFFGVAYSTAKDFGKSLDYLSSGDLSKAIYYSPLPRVLTYPFKALQEYKWGLTTSGDLIIDDPATGRPMKATQQEALLQSIGFTPERISEFKNLYYTYKTLSQYYSQKRKQLYSEYKVALNDGDKDKLIKVVKQMENLNKQIMDINSDYGMGISYANIHNLRSVYSNKSMRNFLYNNLGGK